MTVIAFLPPLPLILVLCAVVGLVYGPIAPIYNYVMQTRAPQHLRGRVVGVMGSLAYAAGPLGLIVAGPLADAAGLHATFLALSLPMLLLGVAAVFLPALRESGPPGRLAARLFSGAALGPRLAIAASSSRELAPTRWQARYTWPSTLRTDITGGRRSRGWTGRPRRVRRSHADARSGVGSRGCATPVCTAPRTHR